MRAKMNGGASLERDLGEENHTLAYEGMPIGSSMDKDGIHSVCCCCWVRELS